VSVPRGLLIALEGTEGVGKTTQVAAVAERLRGRGVPVTVVREPGGTPLGEAIRGLLLDPAGDVAPRAEALLFMASRAQLMERVVEPALERGEVVLMDRFFLSTYAYQIAARGLPEETVRAANALATAGRAPELTVLLTLGAGEGLERARGRGGVDRMERAGDDFHERVERAFATFAETEWQRTHPEAGIVVAVHAAGTIESVSDRILSELEAQWPETFAARTR
jgi:dTMP kinase